MCGIIGGASQHPIRDRSWLAVGRDSLAHRGPDASGEFWSENGQAGLGHRRLAIIDLSADAHQPMTSANGRLTIAFNGEIYNYRSVRSELEYLGHSFRTKSDTEVLLLAYSEWGAECLTKIDGMFAFAIYDAANNTMFIARDRAGEKPLFYHHSAGNLRFASELKGLLSDRSMPREVDHESLDYFLAFSYVPGSRCMLRGYHKLPAAHALTFSCESGELNVYPYWTLPPFEEERRSSDDELLQRLEILLTEAVERQLVADVPVGLLLSGGVDSSLITALAARTNRRLKTYTVGFPNTPSFDESSHAQLIADHFGTDHTVLEADAVGPDIMHRLARQYDEPMVDSSMIPTYLVTQQISRQCKVALGGDGGDELFGGYYSASRMAQLQHQTGRLPRAFRDVVAGIGRNLPAGIKGRQFMIQLGADVSSDVPPFMPQFEQRDRETLMANRREWPLVAEMIRRSRVPLTPDAVQRVTRFDFTNYMAEDILVKVDRASMLNSLEVRSPFLDRRLVEFAYSEVPSRLKATPGNRKIILKKLAEKILPPEFDRKRKQGFGIPLATWLRNGEWRRQCEDLLLAEDCTFSRPAVLKLFKGLDRGHPYKEQIFGLCMFELWRREYSVRV